MEQMLVVLQQMGEVMYRNMPQFMEYHKKFHELFTADFCEKHAVTVRDISNNTVLQHLMDYELTLNDAFVKMSSFSHILSITRKHTICECRYYFLYGSAYDSAHDLIKINIYSLFEMERQGTDIIDIATVHKLAENTIELIRFRKTMGKGNEELEALQQSIEHSVARMMRRIELTYLVLGLQKSAVRISRDVIREQLEPMLQQPFAADIAAASSRVAVAPKHRIRLAEMTIKKKVKKKKKT